MQYLQSWFKIDLHAYIVYTMIFHPCSYTRLGKQSVFSILYSS